MSIIKQHIRRQLEDTGISAVPSLGTFTARRRPAFIDTDGCVHAPAYDLAFEAANGNMTVVADTLSTSVSRALNIDTAAARCHIDSEIDQLHRELQLNGFIDFPGMGHLRSIDGCLSFEGKEWDGGMLTLDNYIPATLISSRNIASERLPAAEAEAEPANTPDRSVFLRSLERTASSAAAIVVLALITFVLAQLPGRKNYATNATIGIEAPQAVVPAVPSQPTPEPALVLVFNTPADGVCDVEPVVTENEGAYCLVVASLATKDEALSLIAGNPALKLLEKDGRFRLYTLTGESFAALNNRARTEGLYEQYPSAWICRR